MEYRFKYCYNSTFLFMLWPIYGRVGTLVPSKR